MTPYTETRARLPFTGIRLNFSVRDILIGALCVVLTIVLFGAVYLQPGWPHSAAGAPRIIDGSTLAVQGQNVSLIGLSHGDEAQRARLSSLIGNQDVTCSWRDAHVGRAWCRANGADITRLMLEGGSAPFSGEALNSMNFQDYLRAEFAARRAKRGIWANGAPQ